MNKKIDAGLIIRILFCLFLVYLSISLFFMVKTRKDFCVEHGFKEAEGAYCINETSISKEPFRCSNTKIFHYECRIDKPLVEVSLE